MLDESTRCNLYYDHYKDCNEHIQQQIKSRNRYTIYLLVLLALSALMIVDSNEVENAASDLLNTQFGISHVSIQILRTAELCCLFYISLNYYQCCLYIERSYNYIHNVELILSEITDINIDRESTNYLSNYPRLSDYAHKIYTYGIPLFEVLILLINFYVEIQHFKIWLLGDLFLLFFLILLSIRYILDRYILASGCNLLSNFREFIRKVVKNMSSKKQTFTNMFWLATFLYAMACLLLSALPLILTRKLTDFTETGQIGDTISGCITPFIAMIASYLTFIAFWVQYKANERQRNDIATERFNENFYNLLNIHEQITNSLEFEYIQDNCIQTIKGRSAFRFAYEQVTEKFDKKHSYQGMRGLLKEQGLTGYESSFSPTYFDHYFRCMYRIVKYVDEAIIPSAKDENETYRIRYEYVSILRSKLSRYELVWLFYNGISANGKEKFKPLIERYAILKNLRSDLLTSEEDKFSYADCAFGVSETN